MNDNLLTILGLAIGAGLFFYEPISKWVKNWREAQNEKKSEPAVRVQPKSCIVSDAITVAKSISDKEVQDMMIDEVIPELVKQELNNGS